MELPAFLPEKPFPLAASNVGDYVLYNGAVISPDRLPLNAPIANKAGILKHNFALAKAAHVVVWQMAEGEATRLDSLQEGLINQLSEGKTLRAMAKPGRTGYS